MSALLECMKEAERQIATYEARMAAKDRTITSLCEEKARLEGRVEELEKHLNEAERRLANADFLLRNGGAEIAMLRAKVLSKNGVAR